MTTIGVGLAAWKGARESAARAKSEHRARAATARAARTTWQAMRRFALTVAALGGFTYAAWSVDFRLGLVIGGVCALILEGLSE